MPARTASSTPTAPRRATALPAYNLYGERGPIPIPDLADRLHCESIAERSQLHGWEIRPHRHEALFQCLVIERGVAQAELEGRLHTLRGPALVTVPALAVHGFRFAPDIRGQVFTVAEAHAQALLQPHSGLAAQCLQLHAVDLPSARSTHAAAPAVRELLAAAEGLRAEATGHAAWRGAALDASLLRLCVAAARLLPSGAAIADLQRGPAAERRGSHPSTASSPDPASRAATAPPAARALVHVQRLRALVEARYRTHPTQAELAAQLGITPTQLNRVCQQVLGHPAQAVLHARLLLQAQRELAYSRLSIKQIAFELGFSDAAYFTRFFRRLAGCGPAQWRLQQQSQPSAQVAIQV